jgi:hypothetical protein
MGLKSNITSFATKRKRARDNDNDPPLQADISTSNDALSSVTISPSIRTNLLPPSLHSCSVPDTVVNTDLNTTVVDRTVNRKFVATVASPQDEHKVS